MPSPETSRENLKKAKAAGHPPRPLRSYRESQLIRRLAWQWLRSQEPKCSGRALARQLNVSHTWIQKLTREFHRNPATMQREERVHGPATFEGLRRAQEETRKQRERGWLREPCRWTFKEFKVGEEVVRAVVPTKASLATDKAKPHYAPDNKQSNWEHDAEQESRINEYGKFLVRRGRLRRRRRWYPGMTGDPAD